MHGGRYAGPIHQAALATQGCGEPVFSGPTSDVLLGSEAATVEMRRRTCLLGLLIAFVYARKRMASATKGPSYMAHEVLRASSVSTISALRLSYLIPDSAQGCYPREVR